MRRIDRSTTLLLGAIAGALLATSGCKRAAGAPAIACDEPEYNYGTVAEGEEIKHVFTVKNRGTGPLKIISAKGG